MRLLRALVLLVTFSPVSGCVVWLGVAPDTDVRCENTLECPPLYVCQPNIHRCVRIGSDDKSPGVTGAVRIAPQPARAQVPVVVEFDADEPLQLVPVVEMTRGGIRLGLTHVGGSERHYIFQRVTDGTEQEGDWDLEATLTDGAGNVSERVRLGAVTLDFTAPTLQGDLVTLPSALVQPGGMRTLSIVTSEPLDEAPVITVRVLMSDTPIVATPTAGSGTQWSYSFVAPTGVADGATTALVHLVDPAGNVSDELATPPIVIDGEPAFATGVFITFHAPIGHSRQDVRAAGPGVRVEISFVLNEGVADPPTVSLTGPGELPLNFISQDGLAYVYSAVVPASQEQGTYSAVAQAIDFAGNAGAITLGGVAVLNSIPGAPGASGSDLLTHRRVPWGSDETGGTSQGTVHGRAGSVQALHLVVAESRGVELARFPADTDGRFGPVVLAGDDVDEVTLRAVDEAGNASPPTPIRNVQWVASLGGKQVGNTFSNPHRFEEWPHAVGALRQADGTERGAASGITGRNGTAHTTSQHGTWLNVSPVQESEQPAGRQDHALTFDSARGVAVLFGGNGAFGVSCDSSGLNYCGGTWEWNGISWRQLLPLDPEGDGDPGARIGSRVAWDAVRQQTILFGGKAPVENCDGEQTLFCGATWSWDGASWRKLLPAGSGPFERGWAGLAYDSGRGVVVLFGGITGDGFNCGGNSNVCSDTWEFDGESWTLVAPAGSGPNRRFLHAMAYDEWSRKVVLHGGLAGNASDNPDCGSGTNACGDTWTWNGMMWEDVTTSVGPGARSGAAMAYDPASQGVVLQGGSFSKRMAADPCPMGFESHPPLGCQSAEVWTWSEGVWIPLAPSPAPAARHSHQMTWDTARNETLLMGGLHDAGGTGAMCPDGIIGGVNGTCQLRDTWAHSGGTWQLRTPMDLPGDGEPDGRSFHSLAVNAGTGQVMMAGGRTLQATCDGAASPNCTSVWEYRGRNWNRLPDFPGVGGSERKLVFEEHMNRFTFFGQFRRDLDGVACPSGAGTCDDTWTFASGTWSSLTFPAAQNDDRPPQRCGYSVAYDAMRHVTVLFGGYEYWPTGIPPDPADQQMDCDADADSRRLVGVSVYLTDTWEFDGAAWTEVTGTQPPGREHAGMAYDPQRGNIVLFGGRRCVGGAGAQTPFCDEGPDFEELADTWTLSAAGWSQKTPLASPSARHSMALADDPTRGRLVLAGGASTYLTDCGTGSRFCSDVWAWDGSEWTPVGTTDPEGDHEPAPREGPAMVFDPASARMLLFGAAGGLNDTWLWNGGASDVPGHVFRVNLTSAGIPPGSVPSQLVLEWTPQASASPTGYELRAWLDGHWRPLLLDAPVGNTLRWTNNDVPQLTRLIQQADATMHFMLVPATTPGTGPLKTVSTDDVSVELRYRRP